MNGKFEAHITVTRDQGQDAIKVARHYVSWGGAEWKASNFDADPIMGDKPYSYLTSYYEDEDVLLLRVRRMEKLLKNNGIKVLRSKIERIIYDTKMCVNEIEGYEVS